MRDLFKYEIPSSRRVFANKGITRIFIYKHQRRIFLETREIALQVIQLQVNYS